MPPDPTRHAHRDFFSRLVTLQMYITFRHLDNNLALKAGAHHTIKVPLINGNLILLKPQLIKRNRVI